MNSFSSAFYHRVQESQVLANIQNSDAQGPHPGNPNLILRAQPTVTSILKTLSNKNQVRYERL